MNEYPKTHKCPIAGCVAAVVHERLMCPRHWRLVPPDKQAAVYREYRKLPQSTAHLMACQIAIAAVHERTMR